MNGGQSQSDRVLLAIVAEHEPTLAELAMRAVRAGEAERNFVEEWQGPGDTRDIDLWNAREAALTSFFEALERETRIDRDLFDQIVRFA